MPRQYRNKLKKQKNIRYREKTGVYEIRKQINGKTYFASSKNRDEAVRKFIALLQTEVDVPPAVQIESPKIFPKFSEIAARWLELKKPYIKPPTYAYYVQLFGANINPVLGEMELQNVKQSDIITLINDYYNQGKYRTATKIYQTVKAVFEFAVGEELLERSPMRLIRPPKYEEQNGVALTLEEERELVDLVNGSKCIPEVKAALLFLLYTGIRRSELAGARIEGDFVSVVCSKVRKGFKERRRLIPITPMLARWLPCIDLDNLHTLRPDALTQAMKRLMPAHHLHELRHTFITRCQECGVPREVVSVWAGHAADNTQTSNVYTHFSPDFMRREAKKVNYII